MKRLAIIIGCDFPRNLPSHLLGVKYDFVEMQKFLRSDFGGGWLPQEIVTLGNPNKSELQNALRLGQNADLVWTYFSGHGFQSKNTSFIQIHPEIAYPVKQLWVRATRQVVFVDACRNDVQDDTIPFIGDIEDVFPKQNLLLSRKIYSDLVLRSPKGQILFQSSVSGQSSLDTPTGGLFTKSVLAEIKSWGWSQNKAFTSFHSFASQFPSR